MKAVKGYMLLYILNISLFLGWDGKPHIYLISQHLTNEFRTCSFVTTSAESPFRPIRPR